MQQELLYSNLYHTVILRLVDTHALALHFWCTKTAINTTQIKMTQQDDNQYGGNQLSDTQHNDIGVVTLSIMTPA
jgi:hypothetical protein